MVKYAGLANARPRVQIPVGPKKSNFLFVKTIDRSEFPIIEAALDIGYISFFERISSNSSRYSVCKKLFFTCAKMLQKWHKSRENVAKMA